MIGGSGWRQCSKIDPDLLFFGVESTDPERSGKNQDSRRLYNARAREEFHDLRTFGE
jgi:hypothetical protein